MKNPFSSLPVPKPDPIFSVNAEAVATGPEAINCSAGVLMDEEGKVLLFSSVRKAIEDIAADLPKQRFGYPNLLGVPEFRESVLKLLFGAINPESVAAIATTGGTGALAINLRLMKMLLRERADLVLPSPAWANHPPPARGAGLTVIEVPYLRDGVPSLDPTKEAIEQMKGSFGILLQVGCHNPIGLDLSKGQWEDIAKFLTGKDCVALLDIAYQGFKGEPEEDVWPISLFIEKEIPLLVTWSAAKNHSIYGLRTGLACAVVPGAPSDSMKKVVEGHYSAITRTMHSASATFGQQIVASVQRNYQKEWREDMRVARETLRHKRDLMLKHLPEGFHTALRGSGMFAMLPLSEEQIVKLKTDHKVYLTLDGRINIAGIPERRIGELCKKIIAVM